MLESKTQYTIGRNYGDITFPNDTKANVSSRHAIIRRLPTWLTIEDTGSMNGVFINNTRIKKLSPVKIEAGDSVTFGIKEFTFRIENIQIKVCSTGLLAEENLKLQQHLQLIGGTFEEKLSAECTHLVTSCAKVCYKNIKTKIKILLVI